MEVQEDTEPFTCLKKSNEDMINSSTVLEAKLHKRHNILLLHYVRSMMSQGYINMQHLAFKKIINILTKH